MRHSDVTALQAMPDMHSGIKRPLVHEAEATLFNAYQELQERIVLGQKARCGARASRQMVGAL
jgi:hypothetical protein